MSPYEAHLGWSISGHQRTRIDVQPRVGGAVVQTCGMWRVWRRVDVDSTDVAAGCLHTANCRFLFAHGGRNTNATVNQCCMCHSRAARVKRLWGPHCIVEKQQVRNLAHAANRCPKQAEPTLCTAQQTPVSHKSPTHTLSDTCTLQRKPSVSTHSVTMVRTAACVWRCVGLGWWGTDHCGASRSRCILAVFALRALRRAPACCRTHATVRRDCT